MYRIVGSRNRWTKRIDTECKLQLHFIVIVSVDPDYYVFTFTADICVSFFFYKVWSSTCLVGLAGMLQLRTSLTLLGKKQGNSDGDLESPRKQLPWDVVLCNANIHDHLPFRLTEWIKFWDHLIIDIIYQSQPAMQTTASQRAACYKKGNYKVDEQVGATSQPDPIKQKPSCGYLATNDAVRNISGYYHGHVTNFASQKKK